MKTKNSNQKTGVNIQASYDAYDLNGLPKKVNDNISAKIAANVKACILASGPMDGTRLKYYFERGVQALSTIVEDANFELDNVLIPQKSEITDIRFPESGAIIKVVKPFAVADGASTEGIGSAFSSIPMRDKYSQFIQYRMIMPTIAEPRVTMAITLSMPDELIEEIGGGDFTTRTNVVNKYVASVLKAYLDK
jgi:hypothetical protein